MAESRQALDQGRDFDPNEDRYADAKDTLVRVGQDEDFPEGPVLRVSVSFLANGDVAWKAYVKDPDETAGGIYLGPS